MNLTPRASSLEPLSIAGADYIRSHVASLDQYFGAWAILEEPFRQAAARAGSIDLVAHVRAHQPDPDAKAGGRADGAAAPPAAYPMAGRVAVLNMAGSLMKHSSSLSSSTSTVRLRRQLRLAADSPDVGAILLIVDSPGGTVSGTKDLADDVAAAAAKKPVVAYIEDCGASAAYWIACQATQVFCNATALVGSIGVFMVVEDASACAEKLGVKVHVIKAGDFKGAGVPGTPVSEEQLGEWQRNIDVFYGHFIDAVAAGRRMPAAAVKELADGRVYVGSDAVQRKLVDGVQSFDETLAQLQAKTTPQATPPRTSTNPSTRRNPKMSDEKTEPVAATHREIKAGCPGASSDFILAQLDKGATLADAQSAWMAAQQEQLAKAQQELAEAKKKPVASGKRPGVRALGNGKPTKKAGQKKCDDDEEDDSDDDDAGATYTGDPLADYSEAVGKRMKAGLSRQKAALAVARANPDLHRAYLEATNESHLHDLIGAKFRS